MKRVDLLLLKGLLMEYFSTIGQKFKVFFFRVLVEILQKIEEVKNFKYDIKDSKRINIFELKRGI